jgi:hypothetical protein
VTSIASRSHNPASGKNIRLPGDWRNPKDPLKIPKAISLPAKPSLSAEYGIQYSTA